MKSRPNFVLKTGLLPTFVWAAKKNRSVKVGLWPKKVGFCPLLRDKSGQENGLKNLKNRLKLPEIDCFSAILGHFSRKNEVSAYCVSERPLMRGRRLTQNAVSAHLPTFIFYFYKKLKNKILYINREKKWAFGHKAEIGRFEGGMR